MRQGGECLSAAAHSRGSGIPHEGPWATAVPLEGSPGDPEGASEASMSVMKRTFDILNPRYHERSNCAHLTILTVTIRSPQSL